MKNSINGVINVYKPKGITSFKCVSEVKKILKVRKIGHTGTLDPQAEGILVVCIGEATKIASIISKTRKIYRAEVVFGIETDTYDTEGKILRQEKCSYISERIKNALSSFEGEIEQIPPMYSALSFKGKRLYELAREGKTVERKPRKVTIYRIKFLNYIEDDCPKAEFLIECSSGTYIRSFAYDIGQKIGCPSALETLLREKVGKFSIDNSFTLEEINRYTKSGDIDKFLIPIIEAIDFIDFLEIKNEERDKVRQGQFIYLSYDRVKNIKNFSLVLSFLGDLPVSIGEIKRKKESYIFLPKRVFNI